MLLVGVFAASERGHSPSTGCKMGEEILPSTEIHQRAVPVSIHAINYTSPVGG